MCICFIAFPFHAPLIAMTVQSMDNVREWRRGKAFMKSALLEPSTGGGHGSLTAWDAITKVCIVMRIVRNKIYVAGLSGR